MWKKRVVSLVITTILALNTITFITINKAEGGNRTTFYVGGTGARNYSTIQSAINDASDYDTIFVYNGTYYENLVIEITIKLIGENSNNTIIDGGGTGNVVYVSSDWVNISGFTIQNSGGKENDEAGIHIETSNGATIFGNTIVNNNFDGIYLGYSSSNTIMGNTITNNSNGIVVRNSCNNNIITGNTITENSYSSINLYESSSNTIIGNTITNGESGIVITSSSSNTITGNTITYTKYSMSISSYSTKYNTIIGNTITNNIWGVHLSESSHNTITGNTIANNYLFAILLSSSSYNTIRGNTITDSGNGIELEYSNNNKIYHNNIIDGGCSDDSNSTWGESNNTWDNGYPSGGNYWGNYVGIDANGDGIGDKPVNISGGDRQDRYPLMMLYNLTTNQPPTCSIYANITSGFVPLRVLFTLTGNDSDGVITSFSADFNSDGAIDYFGVWSPLYPLTREYTYLAVGEYEANLTVTDNEGAQSYATETITVLSETKLPPEAEFASSSEGLIVTFNDTSIDLDGYIIDWYWDFGDGTSFSPLKNPVHTYGDEGSYTVTLTVTDDNGDTDTYSKAITVIAEDDGDGTPGFGFLPLMISFLALLVLSQRKRKHGCK